MAKYIEREVYLSILRAKANMAGSIEAAQYFEKAAQILEKLPAANVAPMVHGRWIPFHSEVAGDIQYCSVCEIGFTAKMDYCPNCGAKMDLMYKGNNDATD